MSDLMYENGPSPEIPSDEWGEVIGGLYWKYDINLLAAQIQ